MSERMKILEMLSEGKITPDQAEQLLQALEGKTKRSSDKDKERFSLSDFKTIGSQVSAAVAQSLTDVKRVVEQQLDQWSSSGNHVTVSQSLSIPAEVSRLSVETVNGKIQVTPWEESYCKVEVRATMRTQQLTEAKRSLEHALQINHQQETYELVIHHNSRESGYAALQCAHVDVYVPTSLQKLHAKSKNGAIYVDTIVIDDLHVETTNGAIGLYQTTVSRLHAETENGGVDIQGINSASKNVYVFTRNGTITVEGIPADACITGTARTAFGKVDVRHPSIRVDSDSTERKTSVRLQPSSESLEGLDTTRLHLETKMGSIRIRD